MKKFISSTQHGIHSECIKYILRSGQNLCTLHRYKSNQTFFWLIYISTKVQLQIRVSYKLIYLHIYILRLKAIPIYIYIYIYVNVRRSGKGHTLMEKKEWGRREGVFLSQLWIALSSSEPFDFYIRIYCLVSRYLKSYVCRNRCQSRLGICIFFCYIFSTLSSWQ